MAGRASDELPGNPGAQTTSVAAANAIIALLYAKAR